MHWRILNQIRAQNPAERREGIVKALLKNRGLRTKKQQADFFEPKDPYLLTPAEVGIDSQQLKKAVARIKKAIKDREKIIVYGDYDTDGVCATAVMWEALEKLKAQALPFIPKREEGYGLKVDRIEEFVRQKVGLIITVDQGIVQNQQISRAQKLGLDVIVTDHHLIGKKKPRAFAIVHTTKFSGAGVAWFLAKELLKDSYVQSYSTPGVKQVWTSGLDLAVIGTITDLVSLLGANRSLVKFGLLELKRTKRLGLLSLFDFAGIDKEKISPYEVGYIIGPRLNAAGRMDDPMESLRLLCTRDENRAVALAQKIDQSNRERQDLTEQTALHARNLWLKEDGQSALIFVHHHSYQEGVIGLVASKLTEEFYRPAVVVSQGKEWSKASARSIEEFNIVEAVRTFAELLGDHGGHPRAAGFSVETKKIIFLKKRLQELAEKQLDKESLKPTLRVDAEVELSDLNFELYQQLEKFAPFGMDNPQPVFATSGVRVVEAQTVGRQSRHLSLRLSTADHQFPIRAIGFGLGGLYPQLSPDREIDIAYNLLLDEWNGEKRLQLKLKDIKLASH